MDQYKLVVGIVGKVGSGKSLIARYLSSHYGFYHMDIDQYGHQALEMEKQTLLKTFGSNIISPNGQIDRRALGNKVFQDSQQLLLLNSIVHPSMKREIQKFIQTTSQKLLVVDAALLFEIGLDEFCDFILSVEAPDEEILRRVLKYRSWDLNRAEKVLKAQEYLGFLKEKADFIIYNNGDELKLSKQIEFFVHIIL